MERTLENDTDTLVSSLVDWFISCMGKMSGGGHNAVFSYDSLVKGFKVHVRFVRWKKFSFLSLYTWIVFVILSGTYFLVSKLIVLFVQRKKVGQ